MSATNNTSKQGEQANDSKTATRPHTYEMRHYPHNGLLEQLAFMLVRPPRFIYNPDILRPRRSSHRFTMETLTVPFEAIFYKQTPMDYVILYLHGNGSSAFEGTLFLHCLPDRVGLVCFDFKGCGNRPQGDFITLGQQECKDVDTVARFLKGRGHRVVGWGRSMGAVSLLMSEECDLMVADSAYSNLNVLCKESSAKFLPPACCCIFHCLFPCVFACIQCKVESLAGLTIGDMNVINRLEKMPAGKQICFIHGENDTLIPSYHAQRLYQSFKGRKEILLFEGSHNSARPKDILQKCFEFIEEGLRCQEGNERAPTNPKIVEMTHLSSHLAAQSTLDNQTLSDKQCPNPRQLDPLLKKNIEEYVSLENEQLNGCKLPKSQEEYCEAGLETRPINETYPEDEIMIKSSQVEAKRPKNMKFHCSSERP